MGHTAEEHWIRFLRRGEAILALAAATAGGEQETGAAGIIWARGHLLTDDDPIDFKRDTEWGAGGEYLKGKRGALPDSINDIPVDVLESWAACFWAAQAGGLVTEHEPRLNGLREHMLDLTETVYRRCLLGGERLLDPEVLDVMARLSERYSARLGLDPAVIAQRHQAMAATMRVPADHRRAGHNTESLSA